MHQQPYHATNNQLREYAKVEYGEYTEDGMYVAKGDYGEYANNGPYIAKGKYREYT